MKMAIDKLNINFRPKMSLSFAKMTITATLVSASYAAHADSLTNITKKIARNDPSYVIEATEIGCDGDQRCCYNGYLEVRQKDGNCDAKLG